MSIFTLTQAMTPNGYVNRPGYVQRNGYSCGYFCAKALINTLGNGNDKNLVPRLGLSKDGVGQASLVRTLRSRGVTASIYYDLSFTRMQHFLDAGKLIVVYNDALDHWLILGSMSGTSMRFYDPDGRWFWRQSPKVLGNLKSYGIVCGSKCTK